MMWAGGNPAACRPSQIACTSGRCVESSGPPMVVILMPTTSSGVMPSRVQAVPTSGALVSLSSGVIDHLARAASSINREALHHVRILRQDDRRKRRRQKQ